MPAAPRQEQGAPVATIIYLYTRLSRFIDSRSYISSPSPNQHYNTVSLHPPYLSLTSNFLVLASLAAHTQYL